MIVAVIDLGTNTFNMLITEVFNDGTTSAIFQTKIPVMLGRENIGNNILSEDAIQRAVTAIESFKKYTLQYKTNKIIAKATSAIREAKNGNDFVQYVKNKTGIHIDVISGEQEAEYIYYGVCRALALNNTNSLMMDIGGGSTEFIIANTLGVKWKYSFLLGIARIIEKIKPSDPITQEEILNIENYLHSELKPLFEAVSKNPVNELIGVAGVFESICDIIAHNNYFPELFKGKTEYTFNMNEVNDTHQRIIKSTREERLNMKGLIEMRVDMIVISVLFINVILKELKIEKMRMSAYSLKEGVLWELIQNKG